MEKIITILSNIKVITTGNKPNVENLPPGNIAVGVVAGKNRIYVNRGRGVEEVLYDLETSVSNLNNVTNELQQAYNDITGATGNTTTASMVSYENSDTSLSSISVQGAINEISNDYVRKDHIVVLSEGDYESLTSIDDNTLYLVYET